MQIKDKTARRIRELPPYLFADLDRKVAEVRARGVDVISLGVGDPDIPTPSYIVEAMKRAVEKPENQVYPSYLGSLDFRKACAAWMKKRFHVDLDPEKEIIALIGSKEGIAHFPLAFINPGDTALVPEPSYPVYATSVTFAGGNVHWMPLKEEKNFTPDFASIPSNVAQNAKLMFLNYPNNPTSAGASKEFFEKAIEFASKHGIIVVHDAAYSEIYTGEDAPISILQISGAREMAIEMHSFSKTFNMTGWRIAFAAGNAEIIAALGKVKTNIDSGAFTAIQEAAVEALRGYDDFVPGMREIYRRRRDVLVNALNKAGIEVYPSRYTFYVWAKVPEGFSSMSFA